MENQNQTAESDQNINDIDDQKDAGDFFNPPASEIYLPPVPQEISKFLKKVWSSFVNKMVSLTFEGDENVFEHAFFVAVFQTGRTWTILSGDEFGSDRTQPAGTSFLAAHSLAK